MTQPEGVFVHERALCECEDVGADTRIWAFAQVMAGARVGRGCNLCGHSFIESGAVSVQRGGEILADLGAGQCFGELALLCDVPRSATVEASQPCVLLSIDRARFRDIITHDFEAGMRLEALAQARGR